MATTVLVIATIGKAMLTEPRALLVASGALYLTALLLLPVASRRGTASQRALLWIAILAAVGCNIASRNETLLLLLPFFPIVAALEGIRVGVVASAILAIVTIAISATAGDSVIDTVQLVASFAGGAAFIIAFAHVMEREREARLELERQAVVIEELATARERLRVAQSLHDGVGHFLTAAVVQLEAGRVREADRDQRGAFLLRARDLLHQSLAELRLAVSAMRDPLVATSFDTAIAELIAVSREAGVETTLHVEGTPRPLSSGIEFALYRAVQEALTNVRRHAAASHVAVTLQFCDRELVLTVSDDGCGFEELREGMGLAAIRARARALAGELSVLRKPSGGCELAMRVAL